MHASRERLGCHGFFRGILAVLSIGDLDFAFIGHLFDLEVYAQQIPSNRGGDVDQMPQQLWRHLGRLGSLYPPELRASLFTDFAVRACLRRLADADAPELQSLCLAAALQRL